MFSNWIPFSVYKCMETYTHENGNVAFLEGDTYRTNKFGYLVCRGGVGWYNTPVQFKFFSKGDKT